MPGIGSFLGSIIGNAFGPVGGIAGGLLGDIGSNLIGGLADKAMSWIGGLSDKGGARSNDIGSQLRYTVAQAGKRAVGQFANYANTNLRRALPTSYEDDQEMEYARPVLRRKFDRGPNAGVSQFRGQKPQYQIEEEEPME